jgi:hypothetical protein
VDRILVQQIKKNMKKIWLTLAAAIIFMAGWSQEQRIQIKKVKKGDEPPAVMDAIRSQFPEAIVDQLSYLPYKLYGEEWNVRVDGTPLDDVSLYRVHIKQGQQEFNGVYDKNGKMLSSQTFVDFAALPVEVRTSLDKFKGWHVDHAHEYIQYNGKKTSDTYRVKLQKGAEHKILFMDPMGNIRNTRVTLF